MLKYYLKCFRQAVLDALRFFDLHSVRAWLNIVVPGGLTFFGLWRFVGSQQLLNELPKWSIAVLASFAWGLLVFGWQLLISPFRLASLDQTQIQQLKQQVASLNESLKPRIQISFGERGSYIQGQHPNILYRIGVRNISDSTSIENVFVELVDIKPETPSFLPMKLHLMNDNPPNKEFQDSFELAPSQMKYIDTIEIQHKPEGVQFLFKHIVGNIGPYLAMKPDSFTIAVRGKNSPSVQADFLIINLEGKFVPRMSL